ncbi:MAG: hypothetical protein KGZ85_08935 [Ignavibacterium sp.]|nr:hypothetical protein [Ignavibacterium sp.]
MKKLIKLFSLFTLAGLLFIGCQSAEDLTSPVGDLERRGSISWGTPPLAVNANAGEITQIDLVAGQNQVVGYLEVEVSGTDLLITYHTTGGWYITETHLQVVAQPNQFTVNPAGNPKIGNFPYGDENLNTNEISYTVPIPGNLTDGMVYIGAHAVVCTEGTGSGTSASICPTIPQSDVLTYFDNENPNYYFNLQFTGIGSLPGWCIDPSRGIFASQTPINMNFVCSYNLGDLSCIVDKSHNISAANWLINNRGSYNKDQITATFWSLLSNYDWQSELPPGYGLGWEAIAAEALLNGANFVPECGQKVLIFAYDQDGIGSNPCDKITKQVIAFEREVPCEQVCETAWAFNYPADGTSKLFPGHVWFRYFGYKAL